MCTGFVKSHSIAFSHIFRNLPQISFRSLSEHYLHTNTIKKSSLFKEQAANEYVKLLMAYQKRVN